MSKLTIFMFSTIISSFALADFEVPNQFEDGQVTSASQMNENFQALKAEIEILRAQIGQVNSSKRVIMLGTTQEKYEGNGGLVTMTQACQNMADDAYICSRNDVIHSLKPNGLLLSKAWLLDSDEQNCNLFTTNTYDGSYGGSRPQGLVVNENGYISNAYCNDSLSVACCK